MRLRNHNWLLVTGAPRSGTTFVGKMVSLPLRVNYIFEPFNPKLGIEGIDIRYLYLRHGDVYQLQPKYRKIIDNLFTYNCRLRTIVNEDDSFLKKHLKLIFGGGNVNSYRLAKSNIFARSTVIKDPTACLLTEYLCYHYNVIPLILIRHPLSFVGSAKRLGWRWDLSYFTNQKDLISDFLYDEFRVFSECRELDQIFEAAWTWRLLNKVLLSQAQKNVKWKIVTHEELCQYPFKTIKNIYTYFNIPWSNRIEKSIAKFTNSKNPIEAKFNKPHDFVRNSAKIFNKSISYLTESEKSKVWSITSPIAEKIYNYNLKF